MIRNVSYRISTACNGSGPTAIYFLSILPLLVANLHATPHYSLRHYHAPVIPQSTAAAEVVRYCLPDYVSLISVFSVLPPPSRSSRSQAKKRKSGRPSSFSGLYYLCYLRYQLTLTNGWSRSYHNGWFRSYHPRPVIPFLLRR